MKTTKMSLESYLPKQKRDEQMENLKEIPQGSHVIQSRKETNPTAESKEGHNSHYKNIIHLWEFLMELLADERCTSLISWSRKEHGEFKLKDQEEVAKRWGKLKKRPGMNYDKLSRALRYYYRQGIIKKVPGQRLVYKFHKLPYEYKPRIVDIRLAKQKQRLESAEESQAVGNGNTILQTGSPEAKERLQESLFAGQTSPQSSSLSTSWSSSLSTSSSSLLFQGSSISVPAFPFLLKHPGRNGYHKSQFLYNSSISHPSWLEVAQTQALKDGRHVTYPKSAPASVTTVKVPSFFPFGNEECFQPLPKLKLTKRRSIPVSVITKI